jgi:hypothetical protein
MTLATAAYAHHTDVNAYRFTPIVTSKINRFTAPNQTISGTFEKNNEPHVDTTYNTASCGVSTGCSSRGLIG